MTTLGLGAAVGAGLRRALERDNKVIVMGEDVGALGGVFRVTDTLQKDFGSGRVIDTPLAESGIIGTAFGLALRGYRPVCEIQFDGFIFPAYDQIVNELAKYHSEFDPALPGLYTSTFVMAMNKAKYESLPPDLKKVIDDNSGLETSGWLGKVQHANDARGRKTVDDSSVHRFGKADYEQFKKAASKIDEAWVKEMDGKGFKGQELLDGARALIEKHTKR